MTRSYEVTAATGYRGHKQGETVELDLTDAEAERAIQRGSLTPVEDPNQEGEEDAEADRA